MDDDLLSRQDYARLLQILRQSHNSSLAATRILRLYMDLQAVGVNLTRKMYEVVLQAHIMVGALPESIRLYQDVTDMVGQGTLEHKKVLWTVVDAFGANQMIPDGIAFLDQLPIFSSEDGSATSFFAARPKPPRLTDVSRVMEVFARYPEEDSVLVFSRMVTGLLVKTQDVETLTPLLQRLLLSSHFGEAARVLDMTLAHGMEPRLDQIRLHLLQSAHAFTDKAHHEHAIDQWDTITIQRSRSQDTSPLDPSQSLAEQQAPHSILVAEYSNLLRWRIYEGDLTGAQSAAIHISARGWTPQGIDFHQLCSYMVNHSRSSHYPDYLEVLYTLGGSLVPDLHTYRRLVYAACRRSDLQSALTLFKLVQTRHPDWQLDSTIYNAIISTAAAAGHIRVAEKTLACMLKDGVKPDHFSFHGLLNGYGNAGDLEAAAMIPEHMLKQKLIPTTRTFNLVMKAYLGSRMDLTTTRKLLRVMQSSGQMVPPDLVTFNQLLEGYRRVGNTEWFDAYFDRYFRDKQTPSVSDSACCEEENIVGEGDPDVMQSQDTIAKDGITQSIDNDCKQSMKTVVRPVKSDDWTLFIQLKHSLELRNVDLPTVKELWHAVKPKVVPSTARPLIPQDSVDVNNTDNDKAAPIQPLSSPSRSDDSVLSSTHVPFQKRLDSVWMPATDHEYFRFTTLTLFRAAFRSRGDTTGVKTMDDIISQLFPEHPSSLIFLKRRAMKKFRALTKKTKGKNGSKHSGPSSK
ncbi:hypothetical protein BC939DRAFT_475353 [Gamsiella multidivaricata]|uniref:uncharacterized protein n=1 Tax=Gamsiella multidivaricata TaxID=101098 RepID=UPI0022202ED0|nr:uncharacterized protein BC939DRAFT_475353 [Gamsiella multidivaricata]KAI7827466.1 hypothetical protein BC939DRAFT_475353 [Gamsiella multidivaricata]